MTKHPNIKRWSDEKLDREISFASLAIDANHPETTQWWTLLCTEHVRRQTIAIGMSDAAERICAEYAKCKS